MQEALLLLLRRRFENALFSEECTEFSELRRQRGNGGLCGLLWLGRGGLLCLLSF
jgi:hypothetical protein